MKTRIRIVIWTLICFVLPVAAPPFVYGDDEPPLPVGAPATRPAAVSDEPDLPFGAPSDDEPGLPAGAPANDEPPLPPGLEPEPPKVPTTAGVENPESQTGNWLQAAGLSGFLDFRAGVRTQHDRREKHASLGEVRGQIDFQKTWEKVTFKVVADFIADGVAEDHDIDLWRGQGWLDLRQANVSLSPASWLDVKFGRQILTWGTGDLLFVNDLFPKDWQAFFIGRDVEYLKAPSDAVKMSFFSDLANLDVVYTPRFNSDRFITGERISYYNSTLDRIAGRDAVARTRDRDDCFGDDEWAARLSKNIGGYELAAYGYWGYWKSPGGFDPVAGRATFPRLNVYGASVRGQVGAGIGNIEVGYYDSQDDRTGDDPFVNNSQFRFLAGYERDLPMIAQDLTVGAQYYVELMMNHDAYARSVRALAGPMRTADRARQVITFRITKLLMNQNLTLSLFTYFSPTDADAYFRPSVSYKIDDHWTTEFGGNVFLGRRDHTFFGQFKNDTNVYASLRYSF